MATKKTTSAQPKSVKQIKMSAGAGSGLGRLQKIKGSKGK